MPVQLTIHQPGTTKEDFFKPGTRYEFEQAPILLGNEQSQCPIPGATENLLRIHCEKNVYVLECLTRKHLVEFRGKTLKNAEKQVLHSGDRLTVCACPVIFYVSFPRSPVSWQSNALALLARCGIAMVLVLQLFCIFVLPKLLNKGQFWSGQQMRLNIISRTDQLRQEIHSNENPDPISRLILKSFQQDLQQRTTYLRANSERLTRSQRKKMLQALSDLEEKVQFLKNSHLTGTLPVLQIDRPVAGIIEKVKHE